ncbi:MAG TPA: GGDEF domain-containing protein [Cyanothece sp. UBA12306]|nr:GGDEF domain-containing protein [Cyanothece sp. UBA12306]
MNEIELAYNKFYSLNFVPVGICIIKEDFTIIFWNKCLEEWTKTPREQILGQDITRYFPHLNQPKYKIRIQQIFQGSPPTIFSSQLHKHFFPTTLVNQTLQIQQTTIVGLPNQEDYYALIVIQDVTDMTTRLENCRIIQNKSLAEVAERKQAQEELLKKTTELEQRNIDLIYLNDMSELLQACLSFEEVYKAVSQSAKLLFQELNGGLFIINQSEQIVEQVASWGNLKKSNKKFTKQDCWALRKGQTHLMSSLYHQLPCQHLEILAVESYCIPLIIEGNPIGILYLSSEKPGQLTEIKQLLATNVSRHISLALANIKLCQTLHNQSIRDALTGLYNRRYLEESLEKELERAKRGQRSLGIIMIDVDHFKKFNDTFGHDMGDMVLRKLGGFLQSNIRGSDIACRFGGEELTLILPEASLENTKQRAEQLRQGVKNLDLDPCNQVLTISLGVACFPDHGSSKQILLKTADQALYQAKREGRDRVVCYQIPET